MDKQHNDGGPEFPDALRPGGMSLRDWLAGQALSGCIQMSTEVAKIGKAIPKEKIALACYEIADAMLVARKEKQ